MSTCESKLTSLQKLFNGVRSLSPPPWEVESNYNWSAHCGTADADEYYKRIEHEDEIREAKESLSREQFIEIVISKDCVSDVQWARSQMELIVAAKLVDSRRASQDDVISAPIEWNTTALDGSVLY